MNITKPASAIMAPVVDWAALWGADVYATGCTGCGFSFLLASSDAPGMCPVCFRQNLHLFALEDVDEHVYAHPPEMLIPFRLNEQAAYQGVVAYLEHVPFLAVPALGQVKANLRRLYLPLWLVDALVRGTWQAEAAFGYEVMTNQEVLADGQWATSQQKRHLLRWEPRVGQLTRSYSNTPAPALENFDELIDEIGKYDFNQASPYQAAAIAGAVIKLPNRPTDDAWLDAQHSVRELAEEECRLAAGAEHLRGFNWQPHFPERKWTQLLLPVFTTAYFDDDGRPCPLFIHGQTGHIYGLRRSSVKRASRWSLVMTAAAGAVLLLSLILELLGVSAPLLVFGGALSLLVAAGLGIGGLLLLLRAWSYNRQHAYEPMWGQPEPADAPEGTLEDIDQVEVVSPPAGPSGPQL